MTAFWGTSSAYAPGLLGNDFYDLLTWVDNDSTVNIAWAAAFDASKSPVTVPQTETAVGRPGIAGWPQGAIVAWSGTDGSSTLNLAGTAQLTEYDPIAFSQKATLWGQSAPAGPGVAWGNGRLYLVRADSSGGMHLGWSTDPLNADAWSFTELPDTAIDAPAISTLGPGDGDVWIAWTGTDGNGTLNVASGFRPGSEATYRKTPLDGSAGTFFHNIPAEFQGPDTSPAGPQIEVDDLSLTLAYIGHNQAIYFLGAFAGQFNRYKCSATSDTGPAISGRVDAGGIAWRGLDDDHTLNLSTNPFNDIGAVNDNGGG